MAEIDPKINSWYTMLLLPYRSRVWELGRLLRDRWAGYVQTSWRHELSSRGKSRVSSEQYMAAWLHLANWTRPMKLALEGQARAGAGQVAYAQQCCM